MIFQDPFQPTLTWLHDYFLKSPLQYKTKGSQRTKLSKSHLVCTTKIAQSNSLVDIEVYNILAPWHFPTLMILWYPSMFFHCSLLHDHKELQPTGKAHTGEVCGDLSPTGGSKGRVRWILILRKKERQRQLWWTGHKFCSSSPCTTVGDQVDKSGVKLSLGGRSGGKVVLRFFISHYSSLIWLVVNSIHFSESLPALISTHESFATFSLPGPAEKRVALVHPCPARVSPPLMPVKFSSVTSPWWVYCMWIYLPSK